MRAKFFQGSYSNLEMDMNKFFEEVGRISIKSKEIFPTGQQVHGQRGGAEFMIMLLYEKI